MENEISAHEYFERLKNSKHEMTELGLAQFYENCLALKDKFVRLNQIDALKKLIFIIETIKKEKQCLDLGITQYVDKTSIDKLIEKVASNDIAFIELSRYERVIPDDIAEKAIAAKDIFDNMYVLFTDYIHQHENKHKVEHDPILFGTFEKDHFIHDRFYFIGDWIDEYCDLTLEKFISEYKKFDEGKEVTHLITDFSYIDDIDSLKQTINGLTFNQNTGLYEQKPKESIIKQFINKMKRLF